MQEKVKQSEDQEITSEAIEESVWKQSTLKLKKLRQTGGRTD